MPAIHLAFADTSKSSWTGGGTYAQNLLEALQQYAPDVRVSILSEQPAEVFGYVRYPVVRYASFRGRVGILTQKLGLRWWGVDFALQRSLKRLPGGEVDLVFPGWAKVGRRTAVLCWIPDFQHLHLPEMYTPASLAHLNQKYRQGAERATLVILSSQDALNDFLNFAPGLAHKGRVMNFVARVPTDLYLNDSAAVTQTYHIPEKFFYLPNQFWKHKNHRIVFEALYLLRQHGIRPFVVCTGNPVDSRNPSHFADLMQQISRWGVRDQVAFLGLVPHDHVYALIRQSVAVLNPSLFEGWSTTVEEAKSVGKRLILSDLPVHREQNPPETIFFSPHDADDLAAALAGCWQKNVSGPDLTLESEARQSFPQRMKQYADAFVSIATEAVRVVRRAVQ
jgi:glycosyltransferase involved in cell wall biosynthesis